MVERSHDVWGGRRGRSTKIPDRVKLESRRSSSKDSVVTAPTYGNALAARLEGTAIPRFITVESRAGTMASVTANTILSW